MNCQKPLIEKGILLNLTFKIIILNQHCLKKDQYLESIERAIRNALTKADAKNSEIRQQIYASAWRAHERALVQNTQLDESMRHQRREELTYLMRRIESEYAIPQAAHSQPAEQDSWSPESESRHDSGSLDTVAPSRTIAQHNDDTVDFPQAPQQTSKPIKNNKATAKKRSNFIRLAVSLIALAAFVIIGFSIYNSLSDLGGSTNSANHSPISAGPFKEGEDPDAANWIMVFTPQDATRVSLTGTATAEITHVEGVDYLRIKSPTAKDMIRFDIGEGILNQFANATATFDIIARSSDGKPAQMSVTCDFGEMGNCQRRRYDVTGSLSDFLFDVDFSAHKKVQKSGLISINSDLNGTGRSVDILAIRISKPK